MQTLVIYFGSDPSGLAVYVHDTVAYEGCLPIDYVIDMLNNGTALNAISWRIF